MSAFKVVDVFSATPFRGNPVAIVLDAEGLSTEKMQAIAAWTNLSETTFLLKPTNANADYRLRIFTPRSELPFAGHPTLGSAFAALEAGLVAAPEGQLVQECGVGLVNLAISGEGVGRRLYLDMPDAVITPLVDGDIDEVEAILGQAVLRDTRPAIVNVGAVWVVAQLASAEDTIALKPDFARSTKFEQRLGVTGLSVFGRHRNGPTAIEVRSFAPSCGVNEDPVCGSGNGAVAVFLRDHNLLAKIGNHYASSQGQCVGRSGQVDVQLTADGTIRLGGRCVTCIDGTINLDALQSS